MSTRKGRISVVPDIRPPWLGVVADAPSPIQAGSGAGRGEQAGGRSAHEHPYSPVLAGLAVKRRTGNPAKTAWLPTVRIRPLRTPNGHLRTKAPQRPDSLPAS